MKVEEGGRLLVAPADPGAIDAARSCTAYLTAMGSLVEAATDFSAAVTKLGEADFEIAVIAATERTGLEKRMAEIGSSSLDPVPIVLVVEAAIGEARAFVAAGAYQVVSDPSAHEAIGVAVGRALRFARLMRREARFDTARPDLTRQIGVSEMIQRVHSLVDRATRSTSPVLVMGDVGTGKQLVARGIHAATKGRRRLGPFVACSLPAALPEGPVRLREELFGTASRPGALELADGGTLFLDEISLLPEDLQIDLVALLTMQTEMRLSLADASGDVTVDVRIIAGTSVDLQSEMQEGRLHEELFQRLRVLPIQLPPLHRRPDDIPVIVDALIEQYAARRGKGIVGMTPEAVALLQQYNWPGNLRELQEHLERAVRRARGPSIDRGDLSELAHLVGGHGKGRHTGTVDVSLALDEALSLREMAQRAAAAAEITAIRRALKTTGGNVTHAARKLQVSRLHLQKRMKRYGLRGEESRARRR